MTTIIRRGSMIASDSRYLNKVQGSSIVHSIYGGAKFFILPEKTAVVAISGAVSTPAGVKQLLRYARAVVHALHVGEDLPNLASEEDFKEDYTVMIATKKYTVVCEAVKDEETGLCPITTTMANVPVIIGSGTGFIPACELYDTNKAVVDLVRYGYISDELSGGDVHAFDLTLLNDYPEEDVK